MFKKLLCGTIALLIVFSACSCGKKTEKVDDGKQVTSEEKGEVKNTEVKLPDNEVKAVAEIAEQVTVENTEKIPEIEENVDKLKKEVEDNAEKLKEENSSVYENRQVAVAIMEQSVADMKAAEEANDAEKMKEAANMFKMAQAMWDYDDSKEEK